MMFVFPPTLSLHVLTPFYQTNKNENERMKESLQRLTQQHAAAQQELLALEKTKQKLEDELTKTRRAVITSNYEREAVFADRKEMQQRCEELEKMVEDQQQGLFLSFYSSRFHYLFIHYPLLVIQAMDEERARFKNFVMKYETELNKSESRLSEILSQLFLVFLLTFLYVCLMFSFLLQSEQTIKKLEDELLKKNDELIYYKVCFYVRVLLSHSLFSHHVQMAWVWVAWWMVWMAWTKFTLPQNNSTRPLATVCKAVKTQVGVAVVSKGEELLPLSLSLLPLPHEVLVHSPPLHPQHEVPFQCTVIVTAVTHQWGHQHNI
jgi:hypothetical protein